MATDLEAVTAFARMWNTSDATEVVLLLAEDATYSSFWVFGDMHGKEEISHYLIGKMETFRGLTDPKDIAYAQLAEASIGKPGQAVVALGQGSRDAIEVVAEIQIQDGLIKTISLMPPSFYGPKLSGVYPGLDES